MSKEVIHYNLLEEILAHPGLLRFYPPDRLRDELIFQGYEIKPLSRGHYKGIDFEEGGGYKINYAGNGILAYHPTDRSHHHGAYYKISDGEKGTRRYDLKGKEIT